MSLIKNLEDCGLIREIWAYLDVNNILSLIMTNKDIKNMCLSINKDVSQEITLDFVNNRLETNKKKILINVISSFQNISKLTFKLSRIKPYCNRFSKYHRMNESLDILYSCESICKSLRNLTVSIRDDAGVKGISKLNNLRYLDIYDSMITKDAFYEIGSMSSITSLYCSGDSDEDKNDEALQQISKLIHLKTLNMRSFNITQFGFSQLACLQKITSLDICHCRVENVTPISSMTAIMSLNLSICSLTD